MKITHHWLNWFNTFVSVALLSSSTIAQTTETDRNSLNENLKGLAEISEEMALEEKERRIDKENMLKIHRAIFSHFRDHGELPDYLSDLVPKYLPDPEVLVSPKEKRTGKSVLYGREDPKLPVSYIYEFNAAIAPEGFNRNRENPLTCKEWKLMQLKQYGLITPMLRCHLHSPVLNVAYSGDFYESGLLWENDSGPMVLLRQRPELGPFSKLSSKQTLKIKVIDANDEKPLDNAKVRVALASEFGLLPNQVVATDRDGTCILPLGDWRINDLFANASAPGYVPSRYHWSSKKKDNDPQPKELVLQLEPFGK